MKNDKYTFCIVGAHAWKIKGDLRIGGDVRTCKVCGKKERQILVPPHGNRPTRFKWIAIK